MGQGRHPHQFAPPERGLRYRAVDRRGTRLARQGLQPDGRSVQEEQPAEDRGGLEGRGGARRGDVRALVREDHGGAGPGRRRQRARRLVASVEPIRWLGDSLELLDQRLLPDQTKYVRCTSADEVAAAIRDMVVRGAPAIGCAAAFGVVLGNGSEKSFQILAASRPTAVNLFWALDRMRKAKDLRKEAEAIFAEDLAAN